MRPLPHPPRIEGTHGLRFAMALFGDRTPFPTTPGEPAAWQPENTNTLNAAAKIEKR